MYSRARYTYPNARIDLFIYYLYMYPRTIPFIIGFFTVITIFL